MATTTTKTTAATPPKYNTTTGGLTDYGKSVGAPDVNKSSGSTGGGSSAAYYDTPVGVGGKIDTSTGKILSGTMTGQQATLGTPATPATKVTTPTGIVPPTTANTPAGVPPTAPNNATVNPPNAPTQIADTQANMLAAGAASSDPTRQAAAVTAAKLGQLQASGTAPSDAGSAMRAINNTIGNTSPAPEPPAVMQAVQSDPVTQLIQKYTDLLDSSNNSTTLMQDYAQLRKDSGLDAINAELIHADTIINGTEQDVRNEIQTAGGFGTESQVQAMSLARNKSLLVRYNQLAQMKTDATNQLNTMSQLNMQDKQMAQTKLNTQISALFNLADFQQKAQNNVQEQARWLATNMGVDGLYNAYKNDPRQLGFLEKSLGIAQGGLAGMASNAATERARVTEKENLQIQGLQSGLLTDKLQRANLQSQIDERNTINQSGPVTLTGKPQNASQAAANGYADRLNQANIVVDTIGGKFTGAKSYLGQYLPNVLQSGDRQSFEQAKRNFVTAVLRRESGAAISPSEFATEEQKYFPQPGDKDTTIAQKTAARNTAINNVYREANVSRPVLPGQIIESSGKKYRVESDGETLTPI